MSVLLSFLAVFIAGFASSGPRSAPEDFVAIARARHGDAGERAARFLVEHLPPKDRETLTAEFLTENLDLAFQARREFPWAAAVPEELFLNDVLPYAVFDETREAWRARLLPVARAIVKDARTATEAAQALNQRLFKEVKVHYNTGRKRPNQSPAESIELGKATCTGLSILIVDACRAVGIPARAVGTPMWTNERGNHTWFEIWDGDWHFTGADEYDAQGLDRGWFVGDASQARADVPRYSIYATSWKRDGVAFPLVWDRGGTNVAAVNVTARYAKPAGTDPAAASRASLGVRLFDKSGGSRVIAHVCAVEPSGRTLGETRTKAGTADLNDLGRLDLDAGAAGLLRFTVDGETRELPFGPLAKGDPTINASWDALKPVSAPLAALDAWLALPVAERRADAPGLRLPLSRSEAERAIDSLVADRRKRLATERKDEMDAKCLTNGTLRFRWTEKIFGDAPTNGRSLWISLHGGGNAPAAVNDGQWKNQGRLYEPAEGVYVAPRAPTDTWNLWHEAHIDPLLQRLIEDYVVLGGVNPDRVYLLGYSAGGDGVWQLAPRMADRFAAAAMMAGHPNEATLAGLRNLPFAVFVGANDSAYNRNRIVAERAAELDRLAREDEGGYVHFSRVYEGLGHWMERKDAEALPWMAKFTRQCWPKKIVWEQDDVVHRRFYWLALPPDVPIDGRPKIVATVRDADRTIALTGAVPARIFLRLSDALLDLDQPVTVTVNGEKKFSGRAVRQAAAIIESLDQRADAPALATAVVRWD